MSADDHTEFRPGDELDDAARDVLALIDEARAKATVDAPPTVITPRDLNDLDLLLRFGFVTAQTDPEPAVERVPQHERPGRLAGAAMIAAGMGFGGLVGIVLVEWWAPSPQPDPVGDWIVRICLALVGASLAAQVWMSWREGTRRRQHRSRPPGGGVT